MENYSLSDVAAVTRGDGYGDGFGMGGWWMIILFALIFNGGGLWGGNQRGNAVTEADLCNANSFSELKNSVGRLSDQVGQAYTGLQNGICNLGYETLSNFNTLERQLADCCCTTQRAIDGVNYNGAMNTAAINANTTAGIQKVLDKLCETETNNLRARVNQLELQAAMCGVVRYPTATTFATNCNPFFGGCCNSNI